MLLTAIIWKHRSVSSFEIECSGISIANEDGRSPRPAVEVEPFLARRVPMQLSKAAGL